MIDFKELSEDGTSFEQLTREIMLTLDLHPLWLGKGPDQGRDILITESGIGQLTGFERKWLVQCKHFAHSGRSVGRGDVGAIIADCEQAGAQGYLLVCSTQPSSSLITKFAEVRANAAFDLKTMTWDSVDIEKKLFEPTCFSLGHLFFPKSFASVPWKVYNQGSPNQWTANYKSYYLHLNRRIGGRSPDLRECEVIIERLEQIKPSASKELIRPRAIYYDDKHGQRSGPGLLDSLAAVLRWIRFGSLCRHVFNIRLHWCLVTKR